MNTTIENWNLDPTLIDACLYEYLIKLHHELTLRLSYFEKSNDAYFTQHSFEELLQDNHNLYDELQHHYDTSYANPSYAATKLPPEYAIYCSSFYYEVLMSTPHLFQKNTSYKNRLIQRFRLIDDILENGCNLKELLFMDQEIWINGQIHDDFISNYSPNNFCTVLHQDETFEDSRYLFRYGIYISDTELAFVKQMNSYSSLEIKELASQMVTSYLAGFINRNKVKSHRKCSRIVQIVGLEKITHEILHILHESKLEGVIGELVFHNVLPQAIYDHREEEALYYNDAYMDMKLSLYNEQLECHRGDLENYLGNIIMVAFGQKKLETSTCEVAPSFRKEQNELKNKYEMKCKQAFEQVVPKAEISFTGMAYPVQEIGENYPKIFRDIMSINLRDSKIYEEIQEVLIDALDQGEYVGIKGYKGNETNIKVKMQELLDPLKQTNFVNCGADINIPAGEVYTSPELKNSRGLLHIRQARISKIAFKDIKIEFEDGFVKNYTCANFDTEKENHDLMNEVIFHHRETLPMGEFALGTNTFAYALAKEDGILYLLHTLIFEKLGPHIAIGDTCFAWSEDNPLISVYSGKEMIAKDNDISRLRTSDLSSAYYGVHYDLTIPYEDIDVLYVQKRDGSITPIVSKGKFVLAGCEYLNIALEQLL